MNFKKIFSVGIAVGIFNVPLIAMADGIHTENFTNEASSVRVTSSLTKFCSGTFGAYTPPQSGGKAGVSDVPWGKVYMLCGKASDTCTADIFMTSNCSGAVFGKAALDLTKKTIATEDNGTKYHFTASGTNLTIKYK